MGPVSIIVFHGCLFFAGCLMLVAVLDYVCRRFWMWYLRRKANKEK